MPREGAVISYIIIRRSFHLSGLFEGKKPFRELAVCNATKYCKAQYLTLSFLFHLICQRFVVPLSTLDEGSQTLHNFMFVLSINLLVIPICFRLLRFVKVFALKITPLVNKKTKKAEDLKIICSHLINDDFSLNFRQFFLLLVLRFKFSYRRHSFYGKQGFKNSSNL